MNASQIEKSKNLNPAIQKFNTMYERASTLKGITPEEKQVVYNYGRNLVDLYPEYADMFDEVNGALGALMMSLRVNPPKEI